MIRDQEAQLIITADSFPLQYLFKAPRKRDLACQNNFGGVRAICTEPSSRKHGTKATPGNFSKLKQNQIQNGLGKTFHLVLVKKTRNILEEIKDS